MRCGSLLLLLALPVPLACSERPARAPAARGDAAPPATASPADGSGAATGPAAVLNLDRYPGLTADHPRRLEQDGFFLAPTRAEALFQLYERNERLGLPSFVTPGLALEVYRAVVASVQRDVELDFLAPRLHECLVALVRTGVQLKPMTRGDSPEINAALDRAIAVFAVAARLLSAEGAEPGAPIDEPVPTDEDDGMNAAAGTVPTLVPLPDVSWPELPETVQGMLQEATSRIRTADGVYATLALPREVDFRVFATVEAVPAGRWRAWARTLLWLDLAAPATAADQSDTVTGAVMQRLMAGAAAGNAPVAQTWRWIDGQLARLGRRRVGVDLAAAGSAFAELEGGLAALPRSTGASLRELAASVAAVPRGTLGLLAGAVDADRCLDCSEAERWSGPAAPPPDWAAALAGSAAPDLRAPAPGVREPAWLAAVLPAEQFWAERWLRRGTVIPRPGPDPEFCQPTEAPPVPGAVQPMTRYLDALVGGLDGLAAELRAAGVLPDPELEAPDGPVEGAAYRIQQRLEGARGFLDLLRTVSDAARRGGRLDGVPWTEAQVEALSRVGSWAEALLAETAGADAAAPFPPWVVRAADGSLAGFGRVDALYVVVPTPAGPALARGALYAVYPDLAWPETSGPIADAAWSEWLDGDSGPARPAFLAPVLAEPVPPPPVVGDGVRRCLGPESGADLEL